MNSNFGLISRKEIANKQHIFSTKKLHKNYNMSRKYYPPQPTDYQKKNAPPKKQQAISFQLFHQAVQLLKHWVTFLRSDLQNPNFHIHPDRDQ